jgi:hypothetical protein
VHRLPNGRIAHRLRERSQINAPEPSSGLSTSRPRAANQGYQKPPRSSAAALRRLPSSGFCGATTQPGPRDAD